MIYPMISAPMNEDRSSSPFCYRIIVCTIDIRPDTGYKKKAGYPVQP